MDGQSLINNCTYQPQKNLANIINTVWTQYKDISSYKISFLTQGTLNSLCYSFIIEQMQNQKSDIVEQLIEDKFSQLFSDPFNTVCYECGRKTRQWVQSELAIFLCLYCAGLYKEASDKITIKCVSTDLFTPQELKYLKNGGNRKFKEFLANYQMQQLIYRQRLQTKAVAYYRALLKEEINERQPPMAPDPKTGKQKFKETKQLIEMTPSEVLQQVKTKALFVGGKAVDYSEQAYTTVHHKLTSGQLKEDVKNIAQSISNKAKGFWQTIAGKVNQ